MKDKSKHGPNERKSNLVRSDQFEWVEEIIKTADELLRQLGSPLNICSTHGFIGAISMFMLTALYK